MYILKFLDPSSHFKSTLYVDGKRKANFIFDSTDTIKAFMDILVVRKDKNVIVNAEPHEHITFKVRNETFEYVTMQFQKSKLPANVTMVLLNKLDNDSQFSFCTDSNYSQLQIELFTNN